MNIEKHLAYNVLRVFESRNDQRFFYPESMRTFEEIGMLYSIRTVRFQKRCTLFVINTVLFERQKGKTMLKRNPLEEVLENCHRYYKTWLKTKINTVALFRRCRQARKQRTAPCIFHAV